MAEQYNTRQTLIERVRNQQDERAWEEFIGLYENYIYAIIRKMGVSADDCRDIHQEVLLNIWKKLPEYKKQAGAKFRSWVSAITSNAVKYFIRSKSNKAKTLERVQGDETLNYLNSIKVADIDLIAEEEWEVFLAELALENVTQAYSGKAMEVFMKSMRGEEVEMIAADLQLELTSVYRLKARVKKSMSKEIVRLRSDLE